MVDDFIRCCECSAKAPDTEIESSPFLSALGWRVLRKDGPDGAYGVEWRCKSCWKKFKAITGSQAPPLASSRIRGSLLPGKGSSTPR
jgi:hypothetical protein